MKPHILRQHKNLDIMTDTLTQDLKNIIGNFLKIPFEDIDENENLAIFGMDSIAMIGIIKDISGKYAIKLNPADVARFNTIAEIAKMIVSKYSQIIWDYYNAKSGDIAASEYSEIVSEDCKVLREDFNDLLAQISRKYNIDLARKRLESTDIDELIKILSSEYRDSMLSYYAQLGMTFNF